MIINPSWSFVYVHQIVLPNPRNRARAACYRSVRFSTVHVVGTCFSNDTMNTRRVAYRDAISTWSAAASIPQHLSSTLPHGFVDRFGASGWNRTSLGISASTSAPGVFVPSHAYSPNADACLESFVRQLCVIADAL